MNGNNLPSTFIQSSVVTPLELSPKTHQIARLVALGFSNREIAFKLGISEGHISITKKSPLFQEVVKELMKELDDGVVKAQRTMMEAIPKAAEKLADQLDHDNPVVVANAAVHLLKGTGAVKTSDTGPKVQININDSKLDLILQTIKEIK